MPRLSKNLTPVLVFLLSFFISGQLFADEKSGNSEDSLLIDYFVQKNSSFLKSEPMIQNYANGNRVASNQDLSQNLLYAQNGKTSADAKEIKNQKPEREPKPEQNIDKKDEKTKEENKKDKKKDFSRTGLIFGLPLFVNYTWKYGSTNVDIYSDSHKIASGKAGYQMDKYYLSFGDTKADDRFFTFFWTPEIGYYERKVEVKDFGEDLDASNSNNDNFISGIISDPATGEVYEKREIYSLKYRARFESYFADLILGLRFAGSKEFLGQKFIFSLRPYISATLIEYRRSVFKFRLGDIYQEFTNGYRADFFNSYGAGLDYGIDIFPLGLGFRIGYEYRRLNKFSFPDPILFNENYFDEDLNITRTREIFAKSSRLESHLFTMSVSLLI